MAKKKPVSIESVQSRRQKNPKKKIATPQPVVLGPDPFLLAFGDPSRELAWERLCDEVYADLVALLAEQESLAA